MKRIRLALLVAAANPAFAGTAEAGGVEARNPASVVKVMKSAGYPAELGKDDAGDPVINSRTAGTDFFVHFYDCEEDNTNCSRIQFMLSVAQPRNGSIDRLNGWNSENYFGRAYRTIEGGARLEMDVNLSKGGLSPALFKDNLQWWTTIMESFEQLVRNDKPVDDHAKED